MREVIISRQETVELLPEQLMALGLRVFCCFGSVDVLGRSSTWPLLWYLGPPACDVTCHTQTPGRV